MAEWAGGLGGPCRARAHGMGRGAASSCGPWAAIVKDPGRRLTSGVEWGWSGYSTAIGWACVGVKSGRGGREGGSWRFRTAVAGDREPPQTWLGTKVVGGLSRTSSAERGRLLGQLCRLSRDRPPLGSPTERMDKTAWSGGEWVATGYEPGMEVVALGVRWVGKGDSRCGGRRRGHARRTPGPTLEPSVGRSVGRPYRLEHPQSGDIGHVPATWSREGGGEKPAASDGRRRGEANRSHCDVEIQVDHCHRADRAPSSPPGRIGGSAGTGRVRLGMKRAPAAMPGDNMGMNGYVLVRKLGSW